MALHGDLFSFPLPELLQWLDGSRKTGTLQVSWEGGQRQLFVLSGQVVATASLGQRERIARLLELTGLSTGARVLTAFASLQSAGDAERVFAAAGMEARWVRELARDELLAATADLIHAGDGQFHWTEDADLSEEEWTPAEMGMRELLFESLRWVDEQPDVEKTLPADSLQVRALAKPGAKTPTLQRAVLQLCATPQSLGRLRLALGLSRTAVTRRIYELRRVKLVAVDGAPQLEADPISDMLEKGAVLVREGQYDAAALVASSLLASDPSDRRVREFARLVQQEHVAALYAELPPLSVPQLLHDPGALALLKPEERQIASLVNGQWDVSTVVLASPSRELDTLRTLAKLTRLGLLVPVR
jgi:Domain of unknown function (DUF4388)